MRKGEARTILGIGEKQMMSVALFILKRKDYPRQTF
jgi:hypothetical protein